MARRPCSARPRSSAALTPIRRVFIGPGMVIDEPGTNSPVRVAISNANYGLYFTDTLNLTQRLA